MIDGNTVLLVIDVQKGFDAAPNGLRNNPDMEQQIEKLLAGWRESSRPVVHVKHNSLNKQSPLHPNNSGNDIKDHIKPVGGEVLFAKEVNSAFIGTGLESHLREKGYDKLVMVGFQSDLCVSTTARMAANLGFDTYVVSDATATFDTTDHLGNRFSAQQLHDASLASLHEEFATIVSTSDLLSNIAKNDK